MGYTVEEEYQYGRPPRGTVAGADSDLGTDMEIEYHLVLE